MEGSTALAAIRSHGGKQKENSASFRAYSHIGIEYGPTSHTRSNDDAEWTSFTFIETVAICESAEVVAAGFGRAVDEM